MGYIYKVTNKVNQKVYIGQTSRSVERRWREHCHDSNSHKESRYFSHFHSAIRKYSPESFVVDIIEECNNDLLDERESFWIMYYKSNDKNNGYNLTNGGALCFQKVPEREETRLKKSSVQTGVNNSFYGKHHTRSHRLNISTPVVSFTDDGVPYRYYVSQISAKKDGYQQSHITDCINAKCVHHGKTTDGRRLRWRKVDPLEQKVIELCFINYELESLTPDEYLVYAKGA